MLNMESQRKPLYLGILFIIVWDDSIARINQRMIESHPKTVKYKSKIQLIKEKYFVGPTIFEGLVSGEEQVDTALRDRH